MTEPLRCLECKRPLKHPSPSGYGPDCARKHGLGPPKRRRTRLRSARRPKPAPVPPAPDALPGQDALPLFHFEPTLWSL